MTMDQLNTLRLVGLYTVLAALVALALAIRFIPRNERRSSALARGAANTVGALASFLASGLYLFVDGWREYFAQNPGSFIKAEYGHPFAHAGRFILYVSSLDPVILGIACALLGLVFLFAAMLNFQRL